MPRLRILLAALLLAATVLPLLGLAGPARAVEPDEILTDAGLEARARHLSTQLRCLVCQNQSIDDSNAPLARDLRLLVRERLKAGDTDTQVLAYIVARYGQFVLLRPPLSPATALLWLAPLLFLGAIGLLVARRIGRLDAARAGPAAVLTSDEQKQLDAILARGAPPTGAAKPAD